MKKLLVLILAVGMVGPGRRGVCASQDGNAATGNADNWWR